MRTFDGSIMIITIVIIIIISHRTFVYSAVISFIPFVNLLTIKVANWQLSHICHMRCARHTHAHTLCFGRDVCKMSFKPACRQGVCVCVSTAGPTKPRSITLPTCATACSVYTYIYLLVHRIIQCQCRSPPHTRSRPYSSVHSRSQWLITCG